MKYLLALSLSLVLSSAVAQLSPDEIDFERFTEETQANNGRDSELHFIWWIPTEFWVMAFAQDETMSQDQVEEMLYVLKPYTMFAIVDGAIDPFGGVTYEPKSKIEEYVHVQFDSGEHARPLAEEEISEEVKNLLSAFEPMLANSMGAMGENMHFFVFSDKDRKSNRLFDPTDESKSFELIAASGQSAKFELPLSSLLESKICPVDDAALDGKWIYCPYHGEKLKTKD